jgi:hypothetical protein
VVCFPRRRIRFRAGDEQRGSPRDGQCFHFFGPEPERFAAFFGEFGAAVRGRPVGPWVNDIVNPWWGGERRAKPITVEHDWLGMCALLVNSERAARPLAPSGARTAAERRRLTTATAGPPPVCHARSLPGFFNRPYRHRYLGGIIVYHRGLFVIDRLHGLEAPRQCAAKPISQKATDPGRGSVQSGERDPGRSVRRGSPASR